MAVLTLKDLAAQVQQVEAEIARLEARREALQHELRAIDHEIAGLRGTRGRGRPPGKRGPGRPPGKRGPGRPKGSKNKVQRRTKLKPGQPGITDFIRAKVAKKPVAVAKLAALAAKAGYKSANLPQVIRLMVGKASDLTRLPDDRIQGKGRPGRPPKASKRGRPAKKAAAKTARKPRAAKSKPAPKPATAAAPPDSQSAK